MARTMTEASLPKRLEASRLAADEQTINGSITVTEQVFERFQQAVEAVVAPIEFVLHFYRDPEGHSVLEGTLKTQVNMTCQRCLGSAGIELDGEFQLGLAYSDEKAKHLPKAYEPALMDEKGCVDPWELIEDELILALPMFANHPEGECEMAQLASEPEETLIETDSDSEKENPFAVLAKLKK